MLLHYPNIIRFYLVYYNCHIYIKQYNEKFAFHILGAYEI